MHIAVNLIVS